MKLKIDDKLRRLFPGWSDVQIREYYDTVKTSADLEFLARHDLADRYFDLPVKK